MTAAKVDQTIFVGDPVRKGNCVAACVATLAGVSLSEVPHFIEYGISYGDADGGGEAVSNGNNWWAMMIGYFAGRGYQLWELADLSEAAPDELTLVAGMSERGFLHQVIYRGGELWHDPHPSRAGVLDVREVVAVRESVGFDHEATRIEAAS